MEFNWAGAIDRNRDQLLDIAWQMFVLAGIRTGRIVEKLPQELRLRLLALLRPAEFAARRLIAVAACKLMTVTLRPASPLREPGGRDETGGSAPEQVASKARRAGAGTAGQSELSPIVASAPPPAAQTVYMHDLPERARPATRPAIPAPAADTAPGGRLPAFPLFDPFKPFRHPWLEDEEAGDEAEWSPQFYTPLHMPVDARALCRRIKALAQALEDLEKHAARLARWRARRDAEIAARAQPSSQVPKMRVRPQRFCPMRPGYPPGWRKRPKTHIEEVLWECNFLAHDVWDTS